MPFPARPWLAALALLLASIPLGAGAAPRRIVSLDLCADQYLIALADPNQIVGLSRFARDPAMSFYAERARTVPAGTRSAEQILLLRPDLVIGAPYRQREALAPLAARGVAMMDLPPADGLAGIEQGIRTIAAAIGHRERGTALIASIRARLARVSRSRGPMRTGAYYQRQGYLTGTGTLVDEMMSRVGLDNLARRLRLPVLGRLSVERIALARPDYLIMESDTRTVTDQGTEMLHHPLLLRTFPPGRRIFIPQALTVCGGPSYPFAVEWLAGALRAAERARSLQVSRTIRTRLSR